MVQYHGRADGAVLDNVFAALASPARRAALDDLGRGPRSVSDLAAPHGMSLTGFMKHVHALEAAGLITCVKEGRTVTCALAAEPLRQATNWLSSRERMWSARLDALGRHLSQQQGPASTRKRRG
jgi:DNA-binding transcriptional ArsR family regulator